MKIIQWCDTAGVISGSKGAERMVKALCLGLKKLDHEVLLVSKEHADWIDSSRIIPSGYDIIHHHGWSWQDETLYASHGLPWLSTIHGGGMEQDSVWLAKAKGNKHVMCVSKFVADRIGTEAYVNAGSLVKDFIFAREKKNYFLYLAGFDWGYQKGLLIFLTLARKLRQYDFYVAGSGSNQAFIDHVKELCNNEKNVKFIGEINGREKARYLADAKALIIPTQLPDACPLTVGEALLSGTPVIGSANGALPEIIPKEVGFICKSEVDYVKAIVSVGKIDTQACRDFALENYSDVAIAKKHLVYYEKLIKQGCL